MKVLSLGCPVQTVDTIGFDDKCLRFSACASRVGFPKVVGPLLKGLHKKDTVLGGE